MKRSLPIIPDELKAVKNDTEYLLDYKENEERIHQKCFQGLKAEQEDFSHLVVSGVRFINCRFWNCSFERAEFGDVEFEACDVSGCNYY